MTWIAVAAGGALGSVARHAVNQLVHLRFAWREFTFVGILGGFTTFSAFGLDTLTLARGGAPAAAILAFMRQRSLAVEATVSPSGSPQAAAVGFIVTDDFEMFFDTLNSARKVQNLRSCPSGDDLARLKALYFARFPDGRDRERWKGITYVRVRPQWLRFSDYTQDPPTIIEMMFD